jgi:hypothetical protein
VLQRFWQDVDHRFSAALIVACSQDSNRFIEDHILLSCCFDGATLNRQPVFIRIYEHAEVAGYTIVYLDAPGFN